LRITLSDYNEEHFPQMDFYLVDTSSVPRKAKGKVVSGLAVVEKVIYFCESKFRARKAFNMCLRREAFHLEEKSTAGWKCIWKMMSQKEKRRPKRDIITVITSIGNRAAGRTKRIGFTGSPRTTTAPLGFIESSM
jgi:hypothetical protein